MVQFIGPKSEAKKYTYRLEMNRYVNDERIRLTWEATPRSIRDNLYQAKFDDQLMEFDLKCAKKFSDENGKLTINVTISVNKPPPPSKATVFSKVIRNVPVQVFPRNPVARQSHQLPIVIE